MKANGKRGLSWWWVFWLAVIAYAAGHYDAKAAEVTTEIHGDFANRWRVLRDPIGGHTCYSKDDVTFRCYPMPESTSEDAVIRFVLPEPFVGPPEPPPKAPCPKPLKTRCREVSMTTTKCTCTET